MKITRTMTTFRATAYKLFIKDGAPALDNLGSVEFTATRADKTMARKAFAEVGNPLPKGVEVEIVPVEEIVYGMDLEKFIEMAQVIEKKAPTDKAAGDSDE